MQAIRLAVFLSSLGLFCFAVEASAENPFEVHSGQIRQSSRPSLAKFILDVLGYKPPDSNIVLAPPINGYSSGGPTFSPSSVAGKYSSNPALVRRVHLLPSAVPQSQDYLLRLRSITCVSRGDLFDTRDEYRFSIGGEGYPRLLNYPVEFSMARGQRAPVGQVFPMRGKTTIFGWEADTEISDALSPTRDVQPQPTQPTVYDASYFIRNPPHTARFEYEVIPAFGDLNDPLHPAYQWHPDRRRDAYADFHVRLQNSSGLASSVMFSEAAYLVVADLFGWVQRRYTDEPTEWFLSYGNTLVYEMNYQVFSRLLANPNILFDPVDFLPMSVTQRPAQVPVPVTSLAFDLRMVEVEQALISQTLREFSSEDVKLIDRQLTRLMKDAWLDYPLKWVESRYAGQVSNLLFFETKAINWAKEWIGNGDRGAGNTMIRFAPEAHRIAIGQAMIYLRHNKDKSEFLRFKNP